MIKDKFNVVSFCMITSVHPQLSVTTVAGIAALAHHLTSALVMPAGVEIIAVQVSQGRSRHDQNYRTNKGPFLQVKAI